MSERVTVGIDRNGDPVACKRALSADECERVRHEADLLARTSRSGVVGLVEMVEADDGVELRTRWHAGGSLDQHPPQTSAQAIEAAVALAGIVAELHDEGLAHGRLEPSHVLRDGDGTLRLCGLAEGTWPATDGDLHGDVAALGRLFEWLAATREMTGKGPRVLAPDDPVPDRLRRLARWAQDPDVAVRPNATALARAVHDIAEPRHAASRIRRRGAAPIPAASPERAAATSPWRPLRSISIGFGAVAAVVAGVALLVGRPSTGTSIGAASIDSVSTLGVTLDASPSTLDDPPSTATTVPDRSAASAATTATALWLPQPSCALPDGPDIDGDACPDAVTVLDGDIVVGELRYDLGEPGDDVLIGDWDCDGIATPALWRATTGEVFVFDQWATLDRDVTVEALPNTTALGIEAVVDDLGCSRLRTESVDGTAINGTME